MILGYGFICETTAVTLTGVVINGPVNGTWTYQWYHNGTLLVEETGLTHSNTNPGTYRLEMTCINGRTSCIKSATYNLMNCQPVATDDLVLITYDFTKTPNPGRSYCRLMLTGEKTKTSKSE